MFLPVRELSLCQVVTLADCHWRSDPPSAVVMTKIRDQRDKLRKVARTTISSRRGVIRSRSGRRLGLEGIIEDAVAHSYFRRLFGGLPRHSTGS
jgi:hypothetical protein